jgi:IclR family transcriptional regulator, KDG regulon repressor
VAGVRCVGAPVFDHSGTVRAAVSISGPSARLHDRRLPVLKEQVLGAARDVSRSLGFRDGRGQYVDPGSVVEQEKR